MLGFKAVATNNGSGVHGVHFFHHDCVHVALRAPQIMAHNLGFPFLLDHSQCVFVIELIAIFFYNLIQLKINHLHKSDNLAHLSIFLQLFVGCNPIMNQSSITNLKNMVTYRHEVQFL